jgi:hypothetical protein
MDSFLLASQRLTLTRSGQGETDFSYFTAFLETVSGFPSIALAMPGYYILHPAILQQSMATLFPYLETLRDHLVRSDTSSPFSGAARGPTAPAPRDRRPRKPKNKGKQQQQQQQHRYPRWGPTGPTAFAATPPAPTLPDVAPYVAEIQRLNEAMASMASSPGNGAHYGMLVPPTPQANAHMASSGRPRQYYCWLHGWNNTHNGGQCNVMGANQEYTQQMKAATSPNGTEGNPKIGVPVSFHHSSSNFCFRLSFSLTSPSFLSHSSQVSDPFSAPLLPAAPVLPFASCMHCVDYRAPNPPLLDNNKDNYFSYPAYANEDIRAPALPVALLTSEAQSVPCVRKGTGTSRSASWSFPVVTAACDPLSSDPSNCFLSPSRSPAQQDRIRQNITRQDKTRPTKRTQTRPTTISPKMELPAVRSCHPVTFEL